LRIKLPESVVTCFECIEPDQDDEKYNREHMRISLNTYHAFCDDDEDGFESEVCRVCTTGLVPYHIPTSQVIRYLKNIFSKHNLEV
jgi:hypothetical protein